jgi:hypothetical protein
MGLFAVNLEEEDVRAAPPHVPVFPRSKVAKESSFIVVSWRAKIVWFLSFGQKLLQGLNSPRISRNMTLFFPVIE